MESIARVKGVRPYTKPTVPLTDLWRVVIPVPSFRPRPPESFWRADASRASFSGGAVIDKIACSREVQRAAKDSTNMPGVTRVLGQRTCTRDVAQRELQELGFSRPADDRGLDGRRLIPGPRRQLCELQRSMPLSPFLRA